MAFHVNVGLGGFKFGASADFRFGEYFIQAKHSGLVLDIKGGDIKAGTPVIQWPKKDHDNRNQKWIFTDDHFIASAADNNLVLDVEGGVGEGRKLIIWTKKHHDNDNQKWAWDHGVIRNKADPNLVFDVQGADRNQGAHLLLYHHNGNDNQKFHLYKCV